jgi:polar amino acid transport system permease protein
MWQAFVGDPSKGLSSVAKGLLTNAWMFIAAEALVLIFGLLLAWVRLSHSPVLFPFRVLSTMYTDIFRGIPILLVIFVVGFGVPALQLGTISNQSPAVYGVAALTITYSAYVAEVFRAGIYAVPQGQLMAARSLGLNHPTTMRRVILPQAVRTVIPPLLNDFISLQKDTALVSTLGAIEATRAAQIYASTEFNFSSYTVASLLFLALTIPLTRFTDRLIAKDRAKRLASA